jgi:6-pyruvoyltetrahydropterin/6-carboxytetrahydropterin synthase
VSAALPPRDTVVLRLSKQAMKFSAGHFTLFGPGRRERLHGHDYRVSATLRARVGDDGLCFDYGMLKRRLMALCEEVDEYVLLPGESPLLSVERDGARVHAVFGEERIPFLASDVLVLPVANITLEELARWFLGRLLESAAQFDAWGVAWLEVSVEAGPGQRASMAWAAEGQVG